MYQGQIIDTVARMVTLLGAFFYASPQIKTTIWFKKNKMRRNFGIITIIRLANAHETHTTTKNVA